jgi:hypothetical protein
VVGSSRTIVHPILSRQERRRVRHDDEIMVRHGRGGGASSSLLLLPHAKKIPEKYYCARNACINKRIHELHMDMLAGVKNAEMEMNRYLLLCATLLSADDTERTAAEATTTTKGVQARIAWKCDLCNGSCCAPPVAGVIMARKEGYKMQFRDWKIPGFCSSSDSNGSIARQRNRQQAKKRNNNSANEGAATAAASATDLNDCKLQLPLVQCLRMSVEDTPCYHALPDLGMYMRGILQRRFYTEPVRKHWMKAFTSASYSSSSPHHHHHNNSSSDLPQNHEQQSVLDERTKEQWRYMHGTCANLLLESIPCMKRAKRTTTTASGAPATAPSVADPVETMACINVMTGTLLKLYPLGAKTPTFNARVHLMARY